MTNQTPSETSKSIAKVSFGPGWYGSMTNGKNFSSSPNVVDGVVVVGLSVVLRETFACCNNRQILSTLRSRPESGELVDCGGEAGMTGAMEVGTPDLSKRRISFTVKRTCRMSSRHRMASPESIPGTKDR